MNFHLSIGDFEVFPKKGVFWSLFIGLTFGQGQPVPQNLARLRYKGFEVPILHIHVSQPSVSVAFSEALIDFTVAHIQHTGGEPVRMRFFHFAS